MRLRAIFFLCLAATAAVAAVAAAAPRALRVGLHARWPATPPGAEAAEWLGAHAAAAALWRFADAPGADPVATAAELAGGAGAGAALRWAVAARVMSPRVRVHATLAGEALSAVGEDPGDGVAAFAVVFAHGEGEGAGAGMVRTVHSVEELERAVTGDTREGVEGWVRVESAAALAVPLPDEHVYPAAACDKSAQRPKVVLYAAFGDEYGQWHDTLKKLALDCRAEYVLRWRGGMEETAAEPSLQGYVVEVALKSTEYKVQDDAASSADLFANCPHGANVGDEVCAADTALTESEVDTAEADPVDLFDIATVREKEDAALVAAEHVVKHAGQDPLTAFKLIREFAGDLPTAMAAAYAARDARPKKEAKRSLEKVRRAAVAVRSMPGLAEVLYFNGRRVVASELGEDLSLSLSCLAGISSTAEYLRGVPGMADAVPKVVRAQPKEGSRKLRVDLAMGGLYQDVFTWFNNLQMDSRYAEADWPSLEGPAVADYVEDAEMPFNPDDYDAKHAATGGLVPVRANLLSLVLAVDMGRFEHGPFLGAVDSIVRGNIPIRVALVPVPGDRASTLWAGLFHYCMEIGGLKLTARLLTVMRQMYEYFATGAMPQVPESDELLEVVYNQLLQVNSNLKILPASEIVEQSDAVREKLIRVRKWAEKLGVVKAYPKDKPWDPEKAVAQPRKQDGETIRVDPENAKFDVVGVLNGIVLKDIGTDAMAMAISEQERLASLLKSEEIVPPVDPGEDNMAHWLSSDPSLVIVGKLDSHSRAADKADGADTEPDLVTEVTTNLPVLPLSTFSTPEAQSALSAQNYDEDACSAEASVTVWVLVSSDASRASAESANEHLTALVSDSFAKRVDARVALLADDSLLASLLWKVNVVAETGDEVLYIVNGVVYSPDQVATPSDLQLVVAREASSFGPSARDAAGGIGAPAYTVFHAVMAMRAMDAACSTPERANDKVITWSRIVETLRGPSDIGEADMLLYDSSLLGDDESENPSVASSRDLDLSVVIDPLGKHAVLVSTFVETVVGVFGESNVEVKLLMVPAPSLPSQGPGTLQAVFSRAVLGPNPRVGAGFESALPPAALFRNLPQDALLTVGMVTPRSWFVAPSATGYDLDNIVLSNLPADVSTLHAEFALESLIVEGACVDDQGAPPQGLRLEMTSRLPLQVDTLVMSNLGYFQLKTPSPGRWSLGIAAGRGQEIFDISSVSTGGGIFGSVTRSGSSVTKFSSHGTGEISVLVDSLKGVRNTMLHVKRKKGMEETPLLDPKLVRKYRPRGSRVQKLWNSMYQKGTNGVDSSNEEGSLVHDNRIHVFSVASGHLYERFMKIMMLSVTKHASIPVKFWLLENYLSPSFKKIIPHFAKAHNFEVEMVTYRWPGWLREQTEKQRIIWAYKILFLDVLFPLNLHRVVFVDSDQVVRGDLAELMRMDLKGAPYAYTPFCDSRQEVEGFRFWKTGFWKDALKGANYRISALYVVDLDTFRETSAGDTLRFVYQTLSGDPNSLSNLDQDLPNYASVVPMGSMGTVPIFDLPQEWLWCESWCDDASKASAKTIDLCNNPMTKEPKLESAKRILPEWVDLDAEAFRTSNKVRELLAVSDSIERGDPEETSEEKDEL